MDPVAEKLRFWSSAKSQKREPLALDLLHHPEKVNDQVQCPLYTVLLPEIREVIWQYALQQYEDDRHVNDASQRWVRPGYWKKLSVAMELLFTCRAVYVETFFFPVANNDVHVYNGDAKDCPTHIPLHTGVYNVYQNLRMQPFQFASIVRAHTRIYTSLRPTHADKDI